MRRGEIWWASLPPKGSAPGHRRPVLIIQSDAFNRSNIQTVIAVTVTSNTRLAAAPGNVLLSRKASGLRRESVANVSQIVTADRSILTERVSTLPKRDMSAVEAGVRLVLGL